jgi:hypothetical protein
MTSQAFKIAGSQADMDNDPKTYVDTVIESQNRIIHVQHA